VAWRLGESLNPARQRADTPHAMQYDLRTILDGWEYEPGKISVRKIIGLDGGEKIQTRVDLGLLQCEPAGRPDGQRPSGCESLLDVCERRLREHSERHHSDAGFSLSSDECRELRHEGHLYYQRYLSLFVLEDFAGVERDTSRNLRLVDFCARYAANEADRSAMEAQRGYVMMMNTRARVYGAMQRRSFAEALRLLEEGIRAIQEMVENRDSAEAGDCGTELRVLAALRVEVLEAMPEDAEPRIRWELRRAIEDEDYERAASLRDKLSGQNQQTAMGG
jgi:hypothetical protein